MTQVIPSAIDKTIHNLLAQELERLGIVGAGVSIVESDSKSRYSLIRFDTQEDLNLFKMSSEWGNFPILMLKDQITPW